MEIIVSIGGVCSAIVVLVLVIRVYGLEKRVTKLEKDKKGD